MNTSLLCRPTVRRVLLTATLTVGMLSPAAGALAGRSLTGHAIVQAGVTSTLTPIEVTQTSPPDAKILTQQGELHVTSATKVFQHVGKTAVGGPQKPIQVKRITPRALKEGEEVTFTGTYTPGDPKSIRATIITMRDRSFAVCGALQGVNRQGSNNSGQNTVTLEVAKKTVQEARYARFFPKGKDVVFTHKDATQFHNANGSWKAPKNRVSIQVADIIPNQQVTVVRGKVIGVNTVEVTTVDMGVKCH